MVLEKCEFVDFIQGFRPLTGMVPTLRLRSSSCMSFRPLTGMVHLAHLPMRELVGFRPLTGMVLWKECQRK